MTRDELRQLIADVQRRQSELDNVEVKAARGGTPRRLYEPLSAFANRTGGGVLLFGLDESNTKCRELLGVAEIRAYYLLKKLSTSKRLKPNGKGRWRSYALP